MDDISSNKTAYAIDCIRFYSGAIVTHALRTSASNYGITPGEALRIDALAFEIVKGYKLPM